MRLIALLLAAFVVATPAAAQSWKEYVYRDNLFSISFPAEPTIEAKPYRTAGGGMAQARVYSVARDNSLLRVTVVDLSNVQTDEKTVLDHAVQMLTQGAEVKFQMQARVSRVYGRQLSIAGTDGTRSSVAVFFHRQHLYQIEGIALPKGVDATGDAIRFQQSLVFIDRTSNRSLFEPAIEAVNRALGY